LYLEGSNYSAPQSSASTSKETPPLGKPSPLKSTPAKSAGFLSASHHSADTFARPAPSSILARTKPSKVTCNPTGKSTKSLVSSDAARLTTSGKTRYRSLGHSESPPPAKKRATSNNYRDEIWKILGRSRANYVSMDVFSDDEDMEADATALEKEERQRFRFCYILVVVYR